MTRAARQRRQQPSTAERSSGAPTAPSSFTVRCSSPALHQQSLTVRVPFAIRKRGGRKLVITPDGAAPIVPRQQPNTALVKALARAFRWRDLLESGAYETIGELAKAENINSSYVSRVLRLTLLRPDIVEGALTARPRVEIDVRMLLDAIPSIWAEQQFGA